MRRLLFSTLGFAIMCGGCATAPPKAPTVPEPTNNVLQTAECAELGDIDLSTFGKLKFDPFPYGWTQALIDVERGVVVNVVILDSSPKKLFDPQAIAMLKSWTFPSGASARGCFISHRWD